MQEEDVFGCWGSISENRADDGLLRRVYWSNVGAVMCDVEGWWGRLDWPSCRILLFPVLQLRGSRLPQHY